MEDDAKTDGLPTDPNPHRSVILEDVADRKDWAGIDSQILKRRRGMRKKKKMKPYPGAPNGHIPIVDDVTREKTDQEITMTMNAPLFAHLIPLAKMDENLRMKAELAFDSYLRHMVKIRAKLEEAIDTKNARGFGLFKFFRSEHPRFGTIPDCDAVDPRDLIVPSWSKDLQKAERMTHVLRLTKRELLNRKDSKSWRFVNDVWRHAKKEGQESATDEKSAHAEVASLVGLTTSGKHSASVVVWEFWHYATAWDVAQDWTGSVTEGKKCCTIFSPDHADKVMMIFPWEEEPTQRALEPEEIEQEYRKAIKTKSSPQLEPKRVPGRDRAWPFVQARYENRSRYHYDTRGAGHLCMDDQIFATAQSNAKMTMLDYYQQPLLEGTGSKASSKVTFEPGSYLPNGTKFAQPPVVPSQFDFDIESSKRVAARRVGAASQYEMSGEFSRTRKVQKTKAEIDAEGNRSGLVSSASVDRFNDPLAELYQQLWDDLARLKKPLPLIRNGRFEGRIEGDLMKIYSTPVLIVPSASAKTLDPDAQFVKARGAF